jgi:hypothetical protein
MALAGFLFYFQVLTLQLRIENGLECVGAQIASVDHLETILPELFDGSTEEEGVLQRVKDYAGTLALSGLTGAYVKYALVDSVGRDYLDSSCIKNGSSGLVCYGTTVGAMLYLRVSYRVCIPFVPGQIGSFSVTQRLVRRVWVGLSEAEESSAESETGEASTEKTTAQQVYVTTYGQVYHLYRDCRALKRSIHATAYGDIEEKRNNDGARYYPCEDCIHGSANMIVYITDEGRRYHNSSSCGALLRYIEETTMDQVGSKRLCSYCRSRQEEAQNVE